MNIIDCAIKMRAEAAAQYREIGQRLSDGERQRLFALLAAAEDEHIARLRTINATKGAATVADNGLDEGACHIHGHWSATALQSDPDAYQHVLREEAETIELFERLATETERDSLRKLCRTVAEEERQHWQEIENIYAYVEAPRTYLAWGEFSNLRSL